MTKLPPPSRSTARAGDLLQICWQAHPRRRAGFNKLFVEHSGVEAGVGIDADFVTIRFTSTFCVIWASSIVMDKGPIPGVTFTTSVILFEIRGREFQLVFAGFERNLENRQSPAVVPSLTTLSPR